MAKSYDVPAKVGRLTIIKRGYNIGKCAAYWCECECGNCKLIRGTFLRLGQTTSCGCLQRELIRERKTKHGHTKFGGYVSPTYKSWTNMRRRCREFYNYTSKGIVVCERWNSYENFLSDMGERPKGMTLDRIDNTKGYYKDNCRWATPREQANNQSNNARLEYKGETHTLAEWSRLLGISYEVIKSRYKRRMPVDKVLHKGQLR